ncbi:STAS-like domain-containing protein [Providencia rettgeri]|uniref:DUF4325 domain-containing protein n=1 Tax=Providencia rettgeri TaxID=587 RepID=A0A379FMM8_PRORE|nr:MULTISPECIES: STAS-like domain-containing protein [Providencia]QXB06543.1 STAS-like domain-containing protein [Providencia rettgeri]SUC29623.1 Uncharacterised protein [Providencia rettgeri]
MSNVNIKLPRGDLASRRLAIPRRYQIEEAINGSNTVFLDLSEVESISESYADELFGVLTVKYGHEAVLQKVKISGAPKSVVKNIAIVIQRRKNEMLKKSVSVGSSFSYLATC